MISTKCAWPFAASLVVQLIPVAPAGFVDIAEASFKLPLEQLWKAITDDFEEVDDEDSESVDLLNGSAQESSQSSEWYWYHPVDDDDDDFRDNPMLSPDDDDRNEDSQPSIVVGRSLQSFAKKAGEDFEEIDNPGEEDEDDTEIDDEAKTEKEIEEEQKTVESRGYFVPRPILPIYWITVGVAFFLFLGSCLLGRRMLRVQSLQTKARLRELRSEFTEFVRATPGNKEAPEGGFFHPSHCPPPPRGTFQLWYRPNRSSIYGSMKFSLPRSSLVFAFHMSLITCLMWSALYLLSRNRVWKRFFVTFHGSGEWYIKKDNYWKISIKSCKTICKMLLTPIAFFLLYFLKQRLRWHQMLKRNVWAVQSRLESCAFILSAFLSGEDLQRQRARHDIYRWLTSAQFFNHRGISPQLATVEESELVRLGLLTQEEHAIIGRLLHTFDDSIVAVDQPQHWRGAVGTPNNNPWFNHGLLVTASRGGDSFSLRRVASANLRKQGSGNLEQKAKFMERTATADLQRQVTRDNLERLVEAEDSPSDSESFLDTSLQIRRDGLGGEAQEARVSMQTHCKAASRARDVCLWWVELRVQACVKEKMMDKDKLKKILGAIWNAQRVMEVLINESTNKPMQIQVVLSRTFVDLFILLTPFLTLSNLYRGHIFTMPLVLVNTFIISFFYDAIFQMMIRLWDCFGIDLEVKVRKEVSRKEVARHASSQCSSMERPTFLRKEIPRQFPSRASDIPKRATRLGLATPAPRPRSPVAMRAQHDPKSAALGAPRSSSPVPRARSPVAVRARHDLQIASSVTKSCNTPALRQCPFHAVLRKPAT